MASSATTFDTDCKLMIHGDGTDAATTIPDSSDLAHTITASGNAQLDTAQKKFGTASVLFDGTGDFITVPDHADLDLGSSNFTIDFWVRFAALTANTVYGIFSKATSATNDGMSFVNAVNSSGDSEFRFSIEGADLMTPSAATLAIDTWYHVAIVRKASNSWQMFRDGTSVATSASTSTITDVTDGLVIGDGYVASLGVFGATDNLNGWIDEFRVVKGYAVYTANFTPPTSAYFRSVGAGRFFALL